VSPAHQSVHAAGHPANAPDDLKVVRQDHILIKRSANSKQRTEIAAKLQFSAYLSLHFTSFIIIKYKV
jgi:hypothetical protein